MTWTHQQGFRGNEEDLSHYVFIIEALVKFSHIVLGSHLTFNVFQVKLDLLWLQVILPHVTAQNNAQSDSNTHTYTE